MVNAKQSIAKWMVFFTKVIKYIANIHYLRIYFMLDMQKYCIFRLCISFDKFDANETAVLVESFFKYKPNHIAFLFFYKISFNLMVFCVHCILQ